METGVRAEDTAKYQNAWLMFVAWRKYLDCSGVVSTDSDRDVIRGELAEQASVAAGEVDAADVDREIRARFETAAKDVCTVNRRRWTEDLCAHPMTFCQEGSVPPSRKTSRVGKQNEVEQNDGGGSLEGDVGAMSDPQLQAIQTRRRCSNSNCQPMSHRAKYGSKATIQPSGMWVFVVRAGRSTNVQGMFQHQLR